MRYSKLWLMLAVVLVVSFTVLGFFGWEIYQQVPPIFKQAVTPNGVVLFTKKDIQDGQNIWQSMGGQQVGSIWGHGSYVAPDWTADWIHREAESYLNAWSKSQYGVNHYRQLQPEQLAALEARLKQLMRTNTYNAKTGTLTLSSLRADTIQTVGRHYDALFGNNSAPDIIKLRNAYAIPPDKVPNPANRQKLNAFLFWASWAASTNRPGGHVTYTQNWPPAYHPTRLFEVG